MSGGGGAGAASGAASRGCSVWVWRPPGAVAAWARAARGARGLACVAQASAAGNPATHTHTHTHTHTPPGALQALTRALFPIPWYRRYGVDAVNVGDEGGFAPCIQVRAAGAVRQVLPAHAGWGFRCFALDVSFFAAAWHVRSFFSVQRGGPGADHRQATQPVPPLPPVVSPS